MKAYELTIADYKRQEASKHLSYWGHPVEVDNIKRAVDSELRNRIECKTIVVAGIKTPYEICYNPVTKRLSTKEYNADPFSINLINLFNAINYASEHVIIERNKEEQELLEMKGNYVDLLTEDPTEEELSLIFDSIDAINQRIDELEKETAKKIMEIENVKDIPHLVYYCGNLKEKGKDMVEKEYLHMKEEYDKNCTGQNTDRYMCEVYQKNMKAIKEAESNCSPESSFYEILTKHFGDVLRLE